MRCIAVSVSPAAICRRQQTQKLIPPLELRVLPRSAPFFSACARADALSSLCFHEQPTAFSSSSSTASSLATLTASSSSTSNGTILSGATSDCVPTGALMLCSLPSFASASLHSTLEPPYAPEEQYDWHNPNASDPASVRDGVSPQPSNALLSEQLPAAKQFDYDHATASHYRRMTREEMRREERKLDRRRRRDRRGSVVLPGPVAVTQGVEPREYGGGARREQPHHLGQPPWPAAVDLGEPCTTLPDLVGGARHTRNSSTATSSSIATSMTSCTLETRIDSFALSRSASVASSTASDDRSSVMSTRSHRALKPAFPGIEERDEDDAMNEVVVSGAPAGRSRRRVPHVMRAATDEHHHQDMKAMLDEIIRMEHDFVLSSSASEAEDASYAGHRPSRRSRSNQHTSAVPRTPPLGVAASRRLSTIVPPAPLRGFDRRHSMSATTPPIEPHHLELATAVQLQRNSRGRHAPSKSLSHLEFDDAHFARSPMSTDRVPPRRSASPIRRSLTFATSLENRFDTPPHLISRPMIPVQPTPPHLLVPNATLTTFRFPNATTGLDTPQPSQPMTLLIDTKSGHELSSSDLRTPTQAMMPILAFDGSMDMQTDTPLGPSLFPPSPAPTFAPNSGLRLGMLLGSNDDL